MREFSRPGGFGGRTEQKKGYKRLFPEVFPGKVHVPQPARHRIPVITAPNFPSLQVRIPGHCEPVLRLPWQSPALGESGHNDGGDSHTRLPGHCEPVTDVTGVAIPRLEEPGSLIRVIANQRARWCGNPPVRSTTSRGKITEQQIRSVCMTICSPKFDGDSHTSLRTGSE